MNKISRKTFLQQAGGLIVVPQVVAGMIPEAKTPLLSFSTLGCPDWNLTQIIEFASAHHYNGVEIRGIQEDMDLSKSKHFNSPSSIAETKKRFSDKHLAITELGASTMLHLPESPARQQNLDEAKRFIDIAAALACPFVRVFPNSFPPERSHEETFKLISAGLDELSGYAKGTGVRVLMETHGDLVLSEDILKVMSAVSSKDAGLVWDVANMWSVYKEPPAEVFGKLKPYIFHLHIKDLKVKDDKEELVLLGRGEVPFFEAIDIMVKNHYQGYFSFEWEKRWHPEIEAPEVAFAGYISEMKNHFSKSGSKIQ